MKRVFDCLTGVLLISAIVAVARAAPPDAPRRAFEWQTATPASQGMSIAKLDALKDTLIAHKTAAFLVVRNDKIVYEWYAPEHGPTKPHGSPSLAKAIVGGLSRALPMSDGK